MRIANVAGRAKLLVDGGAVDVERASDGRFGSDPLGTIERIDEVRDWAATQSAADEEFSPARAGPPSPNPKQVFAIGLNYLDHAAESGMAAPTDPVVFTKYVGSFAGPVCDVELPDGMVDWEVEIVAVVGKVARRVAAASAWDHVAGLCLGQDLSERKRQLSGPAPQFGLAKSFPGFSPIGPALVTPDELSDPDDIAIGCSVNGEEVQTGRTSQMIFAIPVLVEYLSGILTLYPGDIIFTGTPPGVGMGRTPPRFLQPGDRLHSWADGIGELEQHMIEGSAE